MADLLTNFASVAAVLGVLSALISLYATLRILFRTTSQRMKAEEEERKK